ncbi:hypothetical protein BJX65DRAFT_276642 [Aspergillus insuetus]
MRKRDLPIPPPPQLRLVPKFRNFIICRLTVLERVVTECSNFQPVANRIGSGQRAAGFRDGCWGGGSACGGRLFTFNTITIFIIIDLTGWKIGIDIRTHPKPVPLPVFKLPVMSTGRRPVEFHHPHHSHHPPRIPLTGDDGRVGYNLADE